MSVINKLASRLGVKSDVPNQELAKQLATDQNRKGIEEIANNLESDDKAIQSDCIKVLYEIGYLKPEMIADYTDTFIRLLQSKNNRLVWGAMIALWTVARLKAGDLFKAREQIISAIDKGSVITMDAGIKALAETAASDNTYNQTLFSYLMQQLRQCRPKSVAQYAESIFTAVTEANKNEYVQILKERNEELNPSQSKRVEKLLRQFQ